MAAEQLAFRFSGECPRPRESTAVRLSSPDDCLGHPGVQGRPHVSTAVVSTALAADPLYLVTADLPLSRAGSQHRCLHAFKVCGARAAPWLVCAERCRT
jgi:hypothetical protein